MAALVLLGSADQVFAWGPATHVGLAGTILDRLSLLPAGIAAILARHGVSYLYGNVAADVVFAKRWSRVKQACHHWSTAFRLLDDAGDDRAKAFAYGYLSHLAADTIAHGKFVPRQVVESECGVNFGHFYWELRADAGQPDSTWKQVERVIRLDQSEHHRSLEQHITNTFLSFEMNRLLFDRMNALTVRQSFRRTVAIWHRFSRFKISANLIDGYHGECLDRIQSILIDGTRSALLREDPNGTSALMQVRVRQREVRRMRRGGLCVGQRRKEASQGLAPRHRPRADLVAEAQASADQITSDSDNAAIGV